MWHPNGKQPAHNRQWKTADAVRRSFFMKTRFDLAIYCRAEICRLPEEAICRALQAAVTRDAVLAGLLAKEIPEADFPRQVAHFRLPHELNPFGGESKAIYL